MECRLQGGGAVGFRNVFVFLNLMGEATESLEVDVNDQQRGGKLTLGVTRAPVLSRQRGYV